MMIIKYFSDKEIPFILYLHRFATSPKEGRLLHKNSYQVHQLGELEAHPDCDLVSVVRHGPDQPS